MVNWTLPFLGIYRFSYKTEHVCIFKAQIFKLNRNCAYKQLKVYVGFNSKKMNTTFYLKLFP